MPFLTTSERSRMGGDKWRRKKTHKLDNSVARGAQCACASRMRMDIGQRTHFERSNANRCVSIWLNLTICLSHRFKCSAAGEKETNQRIVFKSTFGTDHFITRMKFMAVGANPSRTCLLHRRNSILNWFSQCVSAAQTDFIDAFRAVALKRWPFRAEGLLHPHSSLVRAHLLLSWVASTPVKRVLYSYVRSRMRNNWQCKYPMIESD